MAKIDIHQHITGQIIKSIEEASDGDKWRKPWFNVMTSDGNVISKKPYRGINALMTGLTRMEEGYTSSQWGTWNQWFTKGGGVKEGRKIIKPSKYSLKGQTGTHIVFYKPLHITDKDTGQEKIIRMARGYVVFNADQVEGYEPETIDKPLNDHGSGFVFDNLCTDHGVVVKHSDEAAFIPSMDTLTMPKPGQFETREDYECTGFHELTHWTGHKSRLDRKIANRYGSPAYGFEELVAELGSAFLAAHHGISATPRDDHAKYIKGWLSLMKEDNKAVFKAAALAQKAVDYINNTQFEEIKEAA